MSVFLTIKKIVDRRNQWSPRCPQFCLKISLYQKKKWNLASALYSRMAFFSLWGCTKVVVHIFTTIELYEYIKIWQTVIDVTSILLILQHFSFLFFKNLLFGADNQNVLIFLDFPSALFFFFQLLNFWALRSSQSKVQNSVKFVSNSLGVSALDSVPKLIFLESLHESNI